MVREQDEQADATSPGAGAAHERGGHSSPRHAGEDAATPARGRTRTSVMWLITLVGLVVLAFLLVFILQNLSSATVTFLGFSGSLPLAVAMLFSAIGGAGLVGLLGTARMIQLRRAARGRRGARH